MSYRILEIPAPAALAAIKDGELYREFDPEQIVTHAPDHHCAAVDAQGQAQARCSLWWRNVPALVQEALGVIGHYAALNAPASRFLLDYACAQLQQRGCTLAVGPMDGNTWRSYRLVTASSGEPPFFLEPRNPATWPEYWQQAGFHALATYSSGLTTDLSQQDARLARVKQRLHEHGISLRPLNGAAFEQELRRIFAVSLVSFSKNYLYTPLVEADFIQQYRRIQPLVRPELTLIAEEQGNVVGFLFALPDLHEQQRGEPLRTVIVKTVAVLPGSRYAGLGALMVDTVQQHARALGMTRAVHALMHDGNNSRNISGHYGTTMRRYTLFARRL